MVYDIFSQFGKISEVVIKGSQVNNRLQRQNGHGFIRYDGRTYDDGIEAAIRATKVIQQVLINEVLYDCVLSHSVLSKLSNNRVSSDPFVTEGVFQVHKATPSYSTQQFVNEIGTYHDSQQRSSLDFGRPLIPSSSSLSSLSSSFVYSPVTSSALWSSQNNNTNSYLQYNSTINFLDHQHDQQVYRQSEDDHSSFLAYQRGPK
jgi:hypothetical protein